MAKKAKTPRPPVQAPKRRETKSAGLGGMPRWVLVVIAIVAVLVVVGVAVAVTGGGGGGANNDVKKAMEAAGCTYREVSPLPPKIAGNYHGDSPTLKSKVKWSTFPPSGGGHYPSWAVWGFYRAPINPREVVHNLEHGAVVLWWGPQVPKSTVDQLEAFYRETPNSMFGTPIPGLGKKIALTAWTGSPDTYYRDGNYGMGHIAVCTKFDEDAFTKFRNAFRGEGPEGIPESANTPGSGPG